MSVRSNTDGEEHESLQTRVGLRTAERLEAREGFEVELIESFEETLIVGRSALDLTSKKGLHWAPHKFLSPGLSKTAFKLKVNKWK